MILKINVFLINNVFIYFWLHWVFVAALELSLVVASGGYSLVAVCELLIVVASLVAVLGLYVHGLQYSSCRSQA